MNSTFQSFVHSEVKTNRGFRLVEAYLTYKNFTDKATVEFSEFEVVEERDKKSRGNATIVTADPDFTSNTSFQEMPDEWGTVRVGGISKSLTFAYSSNPLNHKRQLTYQTLSKFTPKGQKLDLKI